MTMSVERRRRMLEWARVNRTFIVEDDYDSDFRYEDSPLLALKGMDDSGCVIYAGTFSKSIGAGLRMGYLVVPQKLCSAAVTAKALLDNGHPWLDQAVLAAFIGAGGLGAHLRKIRSIYMRRRDCLLEALRASFGETAVFGSGGGMHVVWRLPPAAPRATRLERELVARGVGVNSFADGGPVFVHGGAARYQRMVLLGYAALTEKEIREGVARIAATLADLGEGADTRPASRPGPGTRSYSL
jgi:GntR family transcriptional regulator/MocR family aminotransferase